MRLENLSGISLNVRNLAILELPAPRLGRQKLLAGDAVELNPTLLTHGWAYRIHRTQTLRLD